MFLAACMSVGATGLVARSNQEWYNWGGYFNWGISIESKGEMRG